MWSERETERGGAGRLQTFKEEGEREVRRLGNEETVIIFCAVISNSSDDYTPPISNRDKWLSRIVCSLP